MGGINVPVLERGMPGGKENDRGAGFCWTVLLGLWLLSLPPSAWQRVMGGKAASGPSAEAGLRHPVLVPGESSLDQLGVAEQWERQGAAPLPRGMMPRLGGAGCSSCCGVCQGVAGTHGEWLGQVQAVVEQDSGCLRWCRDAQGSAGCPG